MQIGSAVGPYRILHHLGSGGMGSVWLAEDTRLHRQVALKTLRAADDDDAPARARLMREARAAAALNHPHIATVYDVLESDGQVIIVFEYVEGETLAARLARGALPAAEAVEMACQITQALVVAHAHGIVHRDLKPANVIVTAGGQLKVLDFGIARMLATGTTQTKAGHTASALGFIGTPAYAAPEQMVSSAVDERADLYALGVMLFEMIGGRRPFMGSDPVALASSKLGQDAPALKSTTAPIPRDLERLVASLLARERDKRPASAGDALAQLRAIYGTPGTGTLALPGSPRRMATTVAAVVLLAAVAGFGAWEIQRMAGGPVPVNATPPVVAVVPLANMSGDVSRDFIAAGIAESLISSLAALPSVTVLSRAAVTDARNRTSESSALARDLGATYLVEGSVQESAGRVRISLNLVRPDRTVAWGDSVEGPFEAIFELQSRLAIALSSALSVQASPDQRARMNDQPTSNTQALSAYWRGRALMERRDLKGSIAAATQAFTEAITLDPEFALAHAAIGEAYWQAYVQSRDQEWARKATEAGLNALRLAPDLPQVRYTLAVTLAGTGKLDVAVDELLRALALQPNFDDARRQLGQVLARQGKVDEAVVEFERAIALRPTAWGSWSAMGVSLFQAARYREAADAFIRVTQLQPDNFFGFQQLGAAYQNLGDYPLALQNYQRALEIRPNPQAYSNVGVIHHLRGEYAAAVAAYQRALELRPNSHITWRNLGDSYRRMSRTRDADSAYQRAIEQAESELKINGTDAGTSSLLAVYLAKAGRHEAARLRLNGALAAATSDAVVHFRGAEVHVLAGRVDDAMSALTTAVFHGMSVARIRDEEDFEPLRKLNSFRSLIQGEKQ